MRKVQYETMMIDEQIEEVVEAKADVGFALHIANEPQIVNDNQMNDPL